MTVWATRLMRDDMFQLTWANILTYQCVKTIAVADVSPHYVL